MQNLHNKESDFIKTTFYFIKVLDKAYLSKIFILLIQNRAQAKSLGAILTIHTFFDRNSEGFLP